MAGDEGGDHSNGRSKIHVKPSHSGQAGSALGHSSPSHATPSGVHTGAHAVTGQSLLSLETILKSNVFDGRPTQYLLISTRSLLSF